MNRVIPGLEHVEGREFIYIQHVSDETFVMITKSALALRPQTSMPQSGGVIEELVRIILKNNISLLGMSYKGDIDGWRNIFTEYCVQSNRIYGFIRNNKLVLSTGSEYLLSDINVVYE
jgi:hypothetical protein